MALSKPQAEGEALLGLQALVQLELTAACTAGLTCFTDKRETKAWSMSTASVAWLGDVKKESIPQCESGNSGSQIPASQQQA